MKAIRITVKIIWGVIAIVLLVIANINLSQNMPQAKSAMQASQLYNEATVYILNLITITLLLTLGNDSLDTQLEQHAKALSEQSKRIADVLDKLERHVDNATSSINVEPVNYKQESISSPQVPETIKQSSIRLCPKCGVPMEIKVANAGKNQGQSFYVCPNYKRCQQVFPVE